MSYFKYSIIALGLAAAPFLGSAQDSNVELDKRARLHYTPEQIAEIQNKASEKIKVLNYYYQQSYVIVKPGGKKAAAKIDLSNFDVSHSENLRRQNERTSIELPEYGCTIELLSLQELENAYKQLK